MLKPANEILGKTEKPAAHDQHSAHNPTGYSLSEEDL